MWAKQGGGTATSLNLADVIGKVTKGSRTYLSGQIATILLDEQQTFCNQNPSKRFRVIFSAGKYYLQEETKSGCSWVGAWANSCTYPNADGSLNGSSCTAPSSGNSRYTVEPNGVRFNIYISSSGNDVFVAWE